MTTTTLTINNKSAVGLATIAGSKSVCDFIVRAVNAHDELLAALERIARPCECYSESAVRFRHGEAQNIARDAIAEGVLPGSEVVVTIVEIRGGKCRVGINAPREISVHREEIQRLIAEEMDSA